MLVGEILFFWRTEPEPKVKVPFSCTHECFFSTVSNKNVFLNMKEF